MDFEYKGGNCVVISSKQGTIVVDGRLSTLGQNDIVVTNAVEVATQSQFATREGRVYIDMPGEYEVSDVSIRGIPAQRLIDHDELQRTTMYRIVMGGISIAVLGHIASPLSDEQLESLGIVDILVVPVGGNGYTLDARQAIDAIQKIDPKVVIPTHYADKDLSYEVSQDNLSIFLNDLEAIHETTERWRVKGDVLPEGLTVIELTRTT